MKKSIFLLILGLSSTFAFSQTSKIAHVETQSMMQELVIKDSVQFKLMKFSQMLQKEQAANEQNLQRQYNELALLQDSLPEEVFKIKYQSYERAAKEYQEQILPGLQKSMQNKELFLLEPIEKKIDEAIEKVAKENKIAYVLRAEALMYAGGTDISKLVRKELGLPEEPQDMQEMQNLMMQQQNMGLPIGN